MSAPRAVVSFAKWSAEFLQDPLGSYDELRQKCPVGWSHADEAWIVTSYKDVYELLHDHRTFSSEAYSDRNGELPPFLVLGQDPPIHDKYRRLLTSWFSPGVAKMLKPKVDEYSSALIDRFIERGSADLVLEYGNPLPALTVLELCGIPTAEWERFAEPNHALQYVKPGMPELEQTFADLRWITEQLKEIARHRRRDPRDDLVSALATAEVDGQPIPIDHVAGILNTVIGGGVDTTTSLYASAVYYLHQNPVDRQRLLEDPELIPTACEEFLRHFTPAQILSREVRQSYTLGGQVMEPGDFVDACIVSANHDEAAFPQASEVLIDRSPNRHAAFGLGIHRCIGSHIARGMLHRMLRDTLDRMPDYQVNEVDAQPYGGPVVNGWIKMPVTFRPGKSLGSSHIGV